MCNIKALFIFNIDKMNFFKIRHKCITFVGIDYIYMYLCTPYFGVRSTKVGQHNILLLTCMYIYCMHCNMHVCRNM